VPEGWRSVAFGNVVDAPLDLSAPLPADRRPYIALEHMAQGIPRLLGWSYAEQASSVKAVFQRGDILFGKLRPNLKKAVQAPFDGVCSTDILVFRSRPREMEPAFLKHLVYWPRFQDYAISTASGTKMPRTSWRLLRDFKVLLPPVHEQKRIASTISSLDDAIEAAQAVMEQLQVVKKAMLAELLTRGIPGRHTQFAQSKIGLVPKAWGVVPFGELIAQGPDNGLYKPQSAYGEGVRIVRITDFANGAEVLAGRLRRVAANEEDTRRFSLSAGDLLINRVNSLSHLGKAAIIESVDETLVFESNIMRVAVDQRLILPRFALLVVSSPRARGFLRTHAKQAVAQASINQQDLRALPIPLPALAEQESIVSAALAMAAREFAEQASIKALGRLKSALLHALLTGEIRVSPEEAPA
jgi:type I restriction enzyme S subunit